MNPTIREPLSRELGSFGYDNLQCFDAAVGGCGSDSTSITPLDHFAFGTTKADVEHAIGLAGLPYRVLLTRGARGMVIFVPPCDLKDHTRSPGFYDPTYRYLTGLGLATLWVHSHAGTLNDTSKILKADIWSDPSSESPARLP